MEQSVIRWKKMGGGSLRGKFEGRDQIIKPGQIFKAKSSEIPMSFRDVVIPLDSIPGVAVPGVPLPEIKAVEVVYKLKPREDGPTLKPREGSVGWYDVVDINDELLNEKGIRKDVAEKLIEDLTLYDVVDSNGKALNEKALKKDVAEKLIEDLAK